MATIASYGFETGVDGDALTTTNGNCNVVNVTGGTAVISTAHPRSGTRSLRMTGSTTAGFLFLTKTLPTAVTNLTETFSMYWGTLPSAEVTIFGPRDTAAAQMWFLNFNGTGRLRLYNAAGTSVWLANTGAFALTTGKQYDITVSGNQSTTAGTLRVQVYDVAAAAFVVDSNNGSAGVWTGTNGALNTGSALHSTYRLGAKCGSSVATGDVWFDDYGTTYWNIFNAAGTVAGTSALSGAIFIRRSAGGTVAGSSTVAGTVGARRPVSGSVTATSTVSGASTARRPASGTIAAVSGLSGAVTARRLTGGTVSGSSTVVGALTRRQTLSGSVAAVSAVHGTVTGSTRPLSGTVAAVSSVTGGITARHPAAGHVVASTAVTGTVSVPRLVSGAVAAVSGLHGAITARHTATGGVTGTSTVTGAVVKRQPTSGSVAAVSALHGTVVTGLRPLSGTIAAVSTIRGTATRLAAFTGHITATSTVAGAVTIAPPARDIAITTSIGPDPWTTAIGTDGSWSTAIGVDTRTATVGVDPWTSTTGADAWTSTITPEGT